MEKKRKKRWKNVNNAINKDDTDKNNPTQMDLTQIWEKQALKRVRKNDRARKWGTHD